jgi:RNA polymerase sigma factor (sigma-70 family)
MTAITQLLESLPEEERIILTMHYIRGLSNLEIAELLGVPERAVESVITTGKSRLLSALNQG